jgi:pyruvate/2-oxoglutarate dehydrogenase complex dihydrolipoamide acyltransferase (E2) component
MSALALVLDIVVVVLLVVTIGYAINLNRQLVRLRDSKAELEDLVRGFAEATERAEAGVEGMKRMAGEAGERLQATVDRGQAIRDELQFMVEAADSLASRLEGTISHHRPAAQAAPPQPASHQAPPARPAPRAPAAEPPSPVAADPRRRPADPAAAEARSRAERELMQALEQLR